MGLILATGRKGSGKSMFMADRIAGDLKEGRKVFSNIPIKTQYRGKTLYTHVVADGKSMLDVIMNEKKCIINADEAGVAFPPNFFNKIPTGFKAQIQQSRHVGIDLYLTTPAANFVVKFLRDQIDELWHFHKGRWILPVIPKFVRKVDWFEAKYNQKIVYDKRLKIFFFYVLYGKCYDPAILNYHGHDPEILRKFLRKRVNYYPSQQRRIGANYNTHHYIDYSVLDQGMKKRKENYSGEKLSLDDKTADKILTDRESDTEFEQNLQEANESEI
jgi:hypothetical protein